MLETNIRIGFIISSVSPQSSLLSIVLMEGCAVLSCAHPLPESALARGRRSRRTRVSSFSHSISHGCRFITTKVSHNPQIFPISLSFRTISSIPKSKNLNVKQFQCGSSFISNSNNGFIRTAVTSSSDDDECDFIVVNFYRFVYIENPEDEVSKHLSFLQGFNIHGRIYINEQGINAQFSGPSKDSMKYVEWIKKNPKFCDVLVQISPTFNGNHAFPRLKLRYKPSLVQYEGGISHLPLLESSNRAIPLTPNQWRERLLRVSSNGDRSFILLDVRNGYEWDVGHFDGAQRPDVDCFRTTSFGLSQSEVKIAAEANDPLSGVDKDRTDILMYCTGGIRCDVYSTILRQRGYRNLYTLKGGVSHYLGREGSFGWIGNLFVFDARLSLPPSAYKPEISSSIDEGGSESKKVASNFARCYICGLQRLDELRHRNCANLDCNLLFLCCNDCVKELRGCCCLNCTSASRLRPVLPGHQRYEKWHIYRDSELRRDSIA